MSRAHGNGKRQAAGDVAAWRHSVIKEALPYEPNSQRRAAATAEIASRTHIRPSGRTGKISERTLRRWLADYDRRHWAGLTPAPRSDAGKARVCISRRWDKGVPFDDDKRAQIAAALRQYIKDLWRNGAPSAPMVALHATRNLIELTTAAGFDREPRELRRLCTVPRALIEKDRKYSLVAKKERDAKGFYDDNLPSVSRTRDGLQPMEIVCGDVHPLDWLFPRPDGSTFTPKMIAWQDMATNRIFVSFVFLPKGKGITQKHIIKSFIEMTQHPHWGMPAAIYIDNGSEYKGLVSIEDALRLVGAQTSIRVGFRDDHPDICQELATSGHEDGVSPIKRARPYNARAKPIEGVFGVLERCFVTVMEGWIGGDRMKSKTHNVGRAPKPYSGGMERFKEDSKAVIDMYDTTPQSGHLNGRSPREAFTAFVEAGWERTDIGRRLIEAAFVKEVIREVRGSIIKVNGKRYYSDELARFEGQRLRVCIPIVEGYSELPVLDDDGNVFFIMEDPKFGFNDPAGAREQTRRTKVSNANITQMRRETNKCDMGEEMRKTASMHAPAPTPNSAGVILLDGAPEAIGKAMALAPTPKPRTGLPEDDPRDIDLWRRIAAGGSSKTG